MNLEQELLKRPGLFKEGKLKKSYKYIADRFGVDPTDVHTAVNSIRKGVKSFPSRFINGDTPKGIYPKMESPNSVNIDTPGTYFVTGCVHAPWHNKRMYDAITKYLFNEVDLSGLILAGDVLDMHSLSRHDKGKIPLPGVTLDYEYEESNKFLDQMNDISRKNDLTKVFLFGNHEDRYFRALSEVDISKYGGALKSPLEALKLTERGYSVISDFKSGHINLGKSLEINHGEFCNVHTAKKTIDTYRKSTLYFHTHRFQIYTEGLVGGWNMGWGGDQNAKVFDYATRAMKKSWLNAAALVTLDSEGYYHVQPLLFINNKLIINGKIYG